MLAEDKMERYYASLVVAFLNADYEKQTMLLNELKTLYDTKNENLNGFLLYLKAILLNTHETFEVANYEEVYFDLIVSSAKKKCREAQYILANHYYEKEEFARAIKLYRESADKGFPPSQWCYGIDLFHGINGYLKQDKNSGLKYIKLSAEQLYEYALSFLIEFYAEDKKKVEIYKEKLRWSKQIDTCFWRIGIGA